jgi:hypothetical protein
MIGIRRGLPREGAAEVVAFVDAEPLELDAALAWARPVKPARTTPPPTSAATSEHRTRDLKRIASFGHLADTPPSPPSDRLGLGRESAQRLHVRGGRVEAPTSLGKQGGRPGYAYRERP